MASPFGSGILQGLESGLRSGMALRRDERLEKRDERLFGLRERELEESTKAREEERESRRLKNALEGINMERDTLGKELTGVISQYGDLSRVPVELRQQYVQRGSELDQVRHGIAAKLYGPYMEERTRKAGELFSNLQSGRISPEDVDDKDFTNAVQFATNRPITDFLDQDGQPSVVKKAYSDFATGMQTNNQALMMQGLNGLLAPDIRKGIGSMTPDGGRIVDKKLARVDPHPENPEALVPSVMITVEYPDGTRKQGLAPITTERTPDPDDDEIVTIDMNKGMDYIHQLYGMAVAANDPDARRKFESGLKKGADKEFQEFAELVYGYGIDPKKLKGKMTVKHVTTAEGVLERYFDETTGEFIKSTRVGSRPAGTGTAAMRELDEAFENGEITQEEYDERRREKLLGKGDKPKELTPEQSAKNKRILAARKQVSKRANELWQNSVEEAKEHFAKPQNKDKPKDINKKAMEIYNRKKGLDENKQFLDLIKTANEPLIGEDDPAWERFTGVHSTSRSGAPETVQGMNQRGVGQEPVTDRLRILQEELQAAQTPMDRAAIQYEIDSLMKSGHPGVQRAPQQAAQPAPQAAPANAPQSRSGAVVYTVKDNAQYDALPSGAVFIGPDGVKRRKP